MSGTPRNNHQANGEDMSEYFLIGANMFLTDGDTRAPLDEHIRVVTWLASFGLCLNSLWVEINAFTVSADTLLSQ